MMYWVLFVVSSSIMSDKLLQTCDSPALRNCGGRHITQKAKFYIMLLWEETYFLKQPSFIWTFNHLHLQNLNFKIWNLTWPFFSLSTHRLHLSVPEHAASNYLPRRKNCMDTGLNYLIHVSLLILWQEFSITSQHKIVSQCSQCNSHITCMFFHFYTHFSSQKMDGDSVWLCSQNSRAMASAQALHHHLDKLHRKLHDIMLKFKKLAICYVWLWLLWYLLMIVLENGVWFSSIAWQQSWDFAIFIWEDRRTLV